jgi:hypothetical protein
MKLYTDEQVKMLLEKMSLVTERKNLGVSANFRHRTIEIDKLLKDISPIELPSDEEIEQHAEENTAESNGTLEFERGFKRGAKWMRDKIQGGNK